MVAGVAPEAGHVDLGGLVVPTWSYDGQIPGPEIRVRKGDVIQALLVRTPAFPAERHRRALAGVAIRNNMDGVPGMTQAPVPAGPECHLPVRGRPARYLLGITLMSASSSTGACPPR